MSAISPLFFLLLFIFGSPYLQNVEAESGFVDSLIDEALSGVLYPVNSMTDELQALLEEVQVKDAEIKRHKEEVSDRLSKIPAHCHSETLARHSTSLFSWSLDSCVSFADDLRKTSQLIWEGGLLAVNITETLGQIGNNILNCPGWNVWKTVECYNSNLKGLKNTIQGIRNRTMPVIEEGWDEVKQTRLDFDHCLGIPIKSKQAIEDHLKNC